MGGVADGWAAHALQHTHPTQPMHPTYQPFTSVIHSMMPVTKFIKTQLNPLCANNVKTHYNWST